MNKPPFVVFALPRSRTAWLSRYLSYGDWHCGHDELRHARTLDDVKAWIGQPNTGTVETAGAPFWRLAQQFRPGMQTIVIRRPVADVVESLMRLDLGFDRAPMTAAMVRLDRKLDQIEARVPGCLSVRFDDLADEATCARLFEHCLPYQHDPAWFATMAPLNLQISMAAMMRYARAHKAQTDKITAMARQSSFAALHQKPTSVHDGITIREEPLDAYINDCHAIFTDHAASIGEGPEYYRQLNFDMMRTLDQAGALQTMIARCNGKVFGYLLTIISPSMDDASVLSSQHTTFFASPEFPGLGMKLTRAANEALRAKGVGEIIFRAGVRGDGPRLGTLYRRLGAEDCGRLYMLKIGKA
jgi:hypothetical protein